MDSRMDRRKVVRGNSQRLEEKLKGDSEELCRYINKFGRMCKKEDTTKLEV